MTVSKLNDGEGCSGLAGATAGGAVSWESPPYPIRSQQLLLETKYQAIPRKKN
jgi:hypothetical protein